MTTTLSVAAGGGGDALAALIIGRALDPESSRQPVVASFSWDRYIIDPTPGPRAVHDFIGLMRRAPQVWEVTPGTRLHTGGTSGLTILARRTKARVFLLDPSGGADDISRQISGLADYVGASALRIVDVGGDLIAHGNEPTLASPLADSLALAGAARFASCTTIVIAGPGLDGELPAAQVRGRLASASPQQSRVMSSDVKNFTAALDHHPSEATALLSAAAIGIEGLAEIRDNAALVPLDATSSDLLRISGQDALAIAPVARALVNTRSFPEAERLTREMCGRTELDHERTKAEALADAAYQQPTQAQIRERIAAHLAGAAERGATLVSLRRLTEAAGLRTYDPRLIRAAVGSNAYDDIPLCRV